MSLATVQVSAPKIKINQAVLFIYFVVFWMIITLWMNVGNTLLNKYFSLNQRNPWITLAIIAGITVGFALFIYYSGLSLTYFEQ